MIEHKNFGHFLEEDIMPKQTLLDQIRVLEEPIICLYIGGGAILDIWTKPLREKFGRILEVFTQDSSSRLW